MPVLRIHYDPSAPLMLGDAEVAIALDDALVHAGPIHRAFEHLAHVAPGEHQLSAALHTLGATVTSRRYVIRLDGLDEGYREQHVVEVRVRYSQLSGNFARLRMRTRL